MRVRACVRACVRVCVHVCERVRVCASREGNLVFKSPEVYILAKNVLEEVSACVHPLLNPQEKYRGLGGCAGQKNSCKT